MSLHPSILRSLGPGFQRTRPPRPLINLTSRSSPRKAKALHTTASRTAADPLFNYTSGRWIYNEPLRLHERHLPFNPSALKQIAAASVHKPASAIISITKLAEGGFNRVFSMRFHDGGEEVLARLPYASTVPKGLAVASEVATLDLLRRRGVPVPRVLGYAAADTDAAGEVGAEYMILERRWYGLTEGERLKVTYKLVELEERLFRLELPACGSVFFAEDLPDGWKRAGIPMEDAGRELCVGPDVALRWWFEERSGLGVDRGPYTDVEGVLAGVARKEMEYLRRYGRPRYPSERVYRGSTNYQKSSPEEHMRNLQKYLDIVPHLVPTDPRLHKPTLRHPDLQPHNIFVSDDLDIVGLIDWQHSSALPLFLAAGMPKSFQNYHDEESARFVPPKLPPNLDELDEDERAEELERYRRRHLHFFYLGFTQKVNPLHNAALDEDGANLLTRKIFTHAGEPWEGNNVPLKADLIQLTHSWAHLATPDANGRVPPCPLSFPDDEVQATTTALAEQDDMDVQMERIRGALGISSDGWTPEENYAEAKKRAEEFKQFAVDSDDDPFEKAMTVRHWPFEEEFDEDE